MGEAARGAVERLNKRILLVREMLYGNRDGMPGHLAVTMMGDR
ncbi:MAG: hypothetical protein QOD11_967, partial [Bradyrhizobium sp.]|nr:hypothetical protein [Bradyrhizobium sp.]